MRAIIPAALFRGAEIEATLAADPFSEFLAAIMEFDHGHVLFPRDLANDPGPSARNCLKPNPQPAVSVTVESPTRTM
jgi:hypothetical protein